MNPAHEQLLARLQHDAARQGAAPEDIDAHVAEALGVPLDYYFAYLLVAGALEGYREAAERQTALTVDGDRLRADADPAVRAAHLVDEIGWLASAIYQETVGDGHAEVHASAARILRAVLQLRADVRTLGRDDPALEGASREARDRGLGVGCGWPLSRTRLMSSATRPRTRSR